MPEHPENKAGNAQPGNTEPSRSGGDLCRDAIDPSSLLQGLDALIGKVALTLRAVRGVSVTVQFRGGPILLVHTNSGAQVFAEQELLHRDGPGLRSLRTRRAVQAGRGDLEACWPALAEFADDAGFRAVHAEPLRVRPHHSGVLTLYSADRDLIDPPASMLHPLRDSVCATLIDYCAANPHQDHAGRLKRELHNRELRGYATGILMARHHLSQEQAVRLLQERATAGNNQVNATARAVIREHLAGTPRP